MPTTPDGSSFILVSNVDQATGKPTSGTGSSAVSTTATDRSGTITTGGAAQQLMAANTARRGWIVENVSSGDLWINELGNAAASQPSIRIPPGQYLANEPTWVTQAAISIIGASATQAFAAREW